MAQANCVPSADRVPIPAGTGEPSTNPITRAAGLLARPANHPPHPIPVAVGRADLSERAVDLQQVFTSFSAYVGALLHGTNVPRVLDLRERNTAEVAAEVMS